MDHQVHEFVEKVQQQDFAREQGGEPVQFAPGAIRRAVSFALVCFDIRTR
jgi:hypothetical protein